MLIDLRKDNKAPEYIEWCDDLAREFCGDGSVSTLNTFLSAQQIGFLEMMHNNKYCICKSFRGVGLTIMLCLNTLYNSLYDSTQDNKYNSIFICHSMCGAAHVLNYMMRMLEACNEHLYLTKKTNNEITLIFQDKEITFEFATTIPSDRNEEYYKKYKIINVDNAAWICDKKRIDEIKHASRVSGSNVYITSCPNNHDNLFYNVWNDSMKGGLFKPYAMKWYLEPRFNNELKATDGLCGYDLLSFGMICDALEHGDMIENKWYNDRKVMIGSMSVTELDGDFVD